MIARALLRRVAVFVPVLLGSSILVFAAGRIATPNPSTTALSVFATPDARAQFIHERHLDQPLVEQYLLWLRDALRGNFGRSLITTDQVSHAISQSLPVTLELAFGSLLLTAIVGLALGSFAGLRRGGIF